MNLKPNSAFRNLIALLVFAFPVLAVHGSLNELGYCKQDKDETPKLGEIRNSLRLKFEEFKRSGDPVVGDDLAQIMQKIRLIHGMKGEQAINSFNHFYEGLADLNTPPFIKIDSLRLAGQNAYFNDNNVKAAKVFDKAIAVYDQLDEQGKSDAAGAMAGLLYLRGVTEFEDEGTLNAFALLLTDKRIASHSDPSTLVNIYIRQGNFHLSKKQFADSLGPFKNADEILSEEKNKELRERKKITVKVGVIKSRLGLNEISSSDAVEELEKLKDEVGTGEFEHFEQLVDFLLATYIKLDQNLKVDELLGESISRSTILFSESGKEKYGIRGLNASRVLMERRAQAGRLADCMELGKHAIKNFKPKKQWVGSLPKEVSDELEAYRITSLKSVIERQ